MALVSLACVAAPVTTAVAAAPRAKAAQSPATIPDEKLFTSADAIARWINGYSKKPEPERLPGAVRAMSHFGIFKDNETAGLYLGFMAGVLMAHPVRADALITRMFPLPPEDHTAIIRALAYSGLPDWKTRLRAIVERMPARAPVADKYLTGKLPALAELPLDSGPVPLDVLWGHWFATGGYEPVLRIISILPWSKDGNNADRLTIGSMAKWTLAQNASRDIDLLLVLKNALKHEPKTNAATLREVIDAAEIGETSKIRKDAMTAIETLKVKGSETARNYAWWSQAGQTALALGCITASALGQASVGVPCVIGGAVSGAALKALAPQQ